MKRNICSGFRAQSKIATDLGDCVLAFMNFQFRDLDIYIYMRKIKRNS